MAQQAATPSQPPVDFAVAIWLGVPDEEVLRGLREGWIRRPPGAGDDWQPFPGAQAGAPVAVGAADVRRLRGWLARIDGSVDEAAFDALWQQAGGDDAQRSRTLAAFVASSLGLAADAPAPLVDAALAQARGTARIVRLDDKSADELEALAREDAGVRRALATHARWAVTGDRRLAAAADPDGDYDRFDADSGEPLLSQAWLADRARHAAWLFARERGDDPEPLQQAWRFVDRAAGASADVEVAPSAPGGPVHQVVFARDDGDSISGGATIDRLHGGRGDDVLRGRAGDDVLEGLAGNDVLLGGAGRDDLAGGRGDDELDGGAGVDRLDGGPGADELTGGRGADLLRGGEGADVYVFESGDGGDVVEDDGGSIVIDGVAVHGLMAPDADGGWRSSDGRVRLTRVDAGTHARLRLAYGEGDAIDLAGWSQGRYGITLEGLSAADAGVGAPAGPPADSQLAEWLAAGGTLAGGADPFGNEGASGFGGAVDVASWVDSRAIDAAVRAWQPPAAAAPGAPVAPDGITPADVAEALADGTGDEAAGESAATTWTAPPMPWDDTRATMPVAPALVLQRPR